MSQKSLENIKEADGHLQFAERHIQAAEQQAQQAGDKRLTEKLVKVKESVQTVRQDIKKNLEG
jgi:hypothetical protein